MTRPEVKAFLRKLISEWRIDPHDAGQVWAQVPEDGIDAETLGDWLEGVGYPELATVAYELPEVAIRHTAE